MKFAASLLALALLSPMSLPGIAQDKKTPEPRQERRTYRLTYTLIEIEAGKKVGVQRASMLLNSSSGNVSLTNSFGRSVMKLGSKIPIVTGSYTAESGKVQSQITYLDVGLNVSAIIQESSEGIEAVTKVEQSSMADTPPATPQDPVIRQTMLESSVMLTPGKPLMIGSLDIPGSTHHSDIEVLLERIP